MLDAAEGERFEEAAQLRDAMRTVQTLHDRQQKMATAELGHRDVFGLKRGPGRRRRSRSSRCAAAASSSASSSAPTSAIVGASDGEVLEAAIQQFYELRGAPPEVHVPAEPDEREALESLAVGARRPPRADRRAAARREARPRRSREPQRRARLPDALQPGDGGAVRRARDAAARAGAAGAAAAHRVLRHLDDPGQRDRRVDGGLRGRPDAARASIGSIGSGARDWGSGPAGRGSASRSPSPAVPSPAVQDDFAAMHEVVLRRYRKLLEQGGPFPDLIADRRRQGPAVGGVRGARGARAGEPGGGRHREEGGAALHARSRGSDRARRRTIRRCC